IAGSSRCPEPCSATIVVRYNCCIIKQIKVYQRSKMELRHLRYFVGVAEEHGFARAARRLNVAQPALSKQIHDLETELGVALFERLPRGVRLTRAGEAFFIEARNTLAGAVRALAPARCQAVGAVGGAADAHLAPLGLAALARFPRGIRGGAARPWPAAAAASRAP